MSRLVWLCIRLPPCWVWLPNDVLAGRGLAVAWLKRGECRKVLELGVPVTVFARPVTVSTPGSISCQRRWGAGVGPCPTFPDSQGLLRVLEIPRAKRHTKSLRWKSEWEV
jgi:hypothetical protein